MKMCRLFALFVCFSLGVQAANVLPAGRGQAATRTLKDKNLFLQAAGDGHDAVGKPKLGKSNSKDWANPFGSEKHHPSDRLQCGITEQVGSHTDKWEDCPANCPYFAQNRKDSDHCTFLCVPGAECGRWNPNKPIPDSIKNTKTCRGPKVSFCTSPELDGTDTCKVCMAGYKLWTEDKQCYFEHWTAVIIVSAIFSVLGLVVTVWVVDLCCRESINPETVTQAEEWRSRSKIINREGPKHEIYGTFSTNLCNQDIAGPGMLLHFRFQAFFIFWPFVLAMVWTVLACFHNELFILGTRKFGTPRHNCILVAWGYETQQRLMWTKVLFLAIAYVFSFASFLWFSITQLRKYQRCDAESKTMKDFALELKGLPEIPGTSTEVEKDIQNAVEKATGKTLVGISVCWNYNEKQETVDAACHKDLFWRQTEWGLEQEQVKALKESKPNITPEELEKAMKGKGPTQAQVDKAVLAEKQKEADGDADMGAIHKWMYNKEKGILGPDDEDEEDIKELLEGLVASESAYIVFNTSEDRDEVLRDAEGGKTIEFDATKYGASFGTLALTVEDVNNEAGNVNWHNFGDTDPNAMIFRFFKGFFKVYVPALLIWFFGFYVPYAWSLYNFNYDNGAELPGYFSLIFTIIVCGGNATMYVVCDICCDIIGFRYKDTKQVSYMLMYLAACMINVFLDMVVTYNTAFKVMVGLDFRTYHGTRLADIDTFTEQFETYAMQRSLGENTYRYAWPSTFFLCFVLEPFVTILIPYQIGKAIVRTHKEIRGTCSEAYMAAFEFDLGRYADILLNVFLGIVIFYFPGGYIWTLFFFMAFSHTFIYCFDHWRVINVIPSLKIVSNQVDWYAQVMMCACCGVILSCLVFKMNCETYAGYCMKSIELLSYCSIAGTLHFIVHFALLVYVVPKFGIESDDVNYGMTFEGAAKYEARTWFSVNPVHCLRSKFIHKHEPHCRYATWGKEHLLETNSKIGCFFKSEAVEPESYDVRKSFSAMTQSFSKKEVEA